MIDTDSIRIGDKDWNFGIPMEKQINELLAEVKRLRSYIAHHISDEYRQCPECGSIDFDFKFYYEGMECECDKCDNIWKVEIE